MMSRTSPNSFCSVIAVVVVATGAQAQYRHRYSEREPKQVEHPAPPVPADKRDRVVTAPGVFTGRPYWLALAQCGGIYFKLNVLYTDIAVHARAVKPDPKINAEYTKKLNEAINAATVFFDGANQFPDERSRHRTRRRGSHLRRAVARGGRSGQDHR